jgi:hypothetical protein
MKRKNIIILLMLFSLTSIVFSKENDCTGDWNKSNQDIQDLQKELICTNGSGWGDCFEAFSSDQSSENFHKAAKAKGF